jgi:hypothetical protein
MSDGGSYDPCRKLPPRQPRRDERLFAFSTRDGRTLRCELFDDGDYGVEARFSAVDSELVITRRFDARMDPTRTRRALAVQWAEEERKAMLVR